MDERKIVNDAKAKGKQKPQPDRRRDDAFARERFMPGPKPKEPYPVRRS